MAVTLGTAEEVGDRVVSPRPAVQALPAYRPGPQPRRPRPRDRRRPRGQAGQQRGRVPAAARRRPRRWPPPPARPTATPTTARSCSPAPWPSATASTRRRSPPAAARSRSASSSPRPTTSPGTSLAFAWRSFEMYPLLAQVAGARGDPGAAVPGRHGGPADTHDLDGAGRRDRRHAPALVFVCNPNNPTGTAVRRAELDRVPGRRPRETLVVLDEAYREFVTDPDVPDGLELMRGRPNVAVLRTLLQGVGAGRAAGRLPDRRGPGRRRGGAQDARAVQRLHARPGRGRRRAGQRGRGAPPLRRRRRRARPAHRRAARARPGRRRQPGQLRLAAAGRAHRRGGRRARGAGGHHPAVRRRGHPGHRRRPRGGRRLPRRAGRRARRAGPTGASPSTGDGTGTRPPGARRRLV